MLSKAHILRSSLVLTRASTGVDGSIATQRTLQSVVPPRFLKVTAKPFSSSSDVASEEEGAIDKTRPIEDVVQALVEKSEDEAIELDASVKPDEVKPREKRKRLQQEELEEEPPMPPTEDEFSDREFAEFYAIEKKRVQALKNRHEVRDPYTGLRVMTPEEEIDNDKKVTQIMISQPIVKRRFNMDEYNDWKKEVDAETIRTQQKIEHFKRSGELLKAIQERIQSANDKESQSELQSYLLTKLGYKQTPYGDFISNQIIHREEEAQQAAKRASMIKIDNEVDEFINYNPNQVRDSVTLNSAHAFNADAFIPSSIIDQKGYHETRKLMTQQEYSEARTRDEQFLMDRKLLWQGPLPLMNAQEQEQYYLHQQMGKMLDDDGSTHRAMIEQMQLTPEEKKWIQTKDTISLRSFNYQSKEITKNKALTEAKAQEIQDQLAKLEEDQVKNLQAIQAELERQDAVNPDEIKTDDLTVPGTTDDESKKMYREKKFEEVSLMSDWSEAEKELQKGPSIKDYWNKVTDSEIQKVQDLMEKDPKIAEIFAKLEEQDIKSSEQSEREQIDSARRKYRVGVEREMTKEEIEFEKNLIFFEEGNQYIEFAKAFLAENGEAMSKEEQAELFKVQEQIRQSNEPQFKDITNPFEMNREDLRKKGKYHIEQMKKDLDIFGAYQSTREDELIPNLDYEAWTNKETGTPDGNRRFERIDRVSHDASADKFDKLKLAARQERVYDANAAMQAIKNQMVIDSTVDFSQHLQKAADRIKNPKAYPPIDRIPLGLTPEQQQEWKVQQSMKEQVALAEGRVERDIHLEDWIHQDKSSQMVNTQALDNDMIMLEKTGMKDVLCRQYEEARDFEQTIIQDRQELAKKIKEQKQKLESVLDGHESLQKKLMKSLAAQFEHQVGPDQSRVKLFSDLNKEVASDKNDKKRFGFSKKSKEVKDYERELYSISQMGLHKTNDKKDVLLRQFEFVFDAMRENKIPVTPHIRAHMFEYLTVRNDFAHANSQLQKLTSDMTENVSPVDPHYLSYFLRTSLKHDNIDGVAYLTNYIQRYKVDTSKMPIQKFHSMLDYYLNHNFNLSKVMVFCKFYRQFYTDTIARQLPQVIAKDQKPGTLDHVQLKMLKDRVFSKHDSLVDMRALSRFLVRKTQSKQIIDPLTREDSLLGLIELFTSSPDVYQASSLSKNNHIEPETIAEFFANRLGYPDSLQQIAKVALRLDGTKSGREFSTKMMEKVKAYQSNKNGALPYSFSETALRNLFYKVRSQTLSAHTIEFILYLLQQKGMHPEVIELCERMPTQEIAKYYLTESLLALQLSKGTYESAIEKSGAFSNQTEQSAMSLTQRTKAYMLDKGAQAAYTFFQEEFAKMEEKAQQKKAFLVSLYDTLMPSDDVSFETFKERYLQSSKLASRFAKEGYVINQMERILTDKNYDEIENVFSLYAVMREERLLENAEYFIDEVSHEVIKLKAAKESDQLQAVRRRREKLEQLVGKPDAKTLKAIQKVMQDQPLTAFTQADADQVKKIASIFEDVTQEEAATIEARNDQLIGGAKQTKKEAGKQVTKESVINELTDRGHGKQTIEKLYELLDFDSGKAEITLTQMSLKADENVLKFSKDLQKMFEDKKTAQYFALEDSEKAALRKIQKDYKEHIKGIIEEKFTNADALRLIKQIESDPANIALRDGKLSKDYKPDAEIYTQEDLEKAAAQDAERITKEIRIQEKFINNLQQQFPLLDIRDIFTNEGLYQPAQMKKNSRTSDIADELDPAEERRITAILQACGFVDRNGHFDPVLRAQAEQALLDMRQSNKFQKMIDGDEEVSFSEELSEAGVNDMLQRRIEEIDDHDYLKSMVDQVVEHEASDLSEMEDATDAQKVMTSFWDRIKISTEVELKKHLQEIVTPRIEDEYLRQNIFGGLRRLQQYENPERNSYLHLHPRRHTDRLQNQQKMEKYRDSLLTDHISSAESNRDPQVLLETVHDATAYSMKEELLFAMNKRKHDALPVMIKMFNQIQQKRIGDSFRLDDFESTNVQDYSLLDKPAAKVDTVQVDDLGKAIQKIDLLLNDSRSPIISALAETQKYSTSKLPERPEEYYPDSGSWISQPLDVDMYKRDSDKLAILMRELDRIEKTVEAVDKKVKTCIENVNGEINKQLLAQKKKEEQEAQEKNMARLRLLHNEFKARPKDTAAIEEHKVRVMREILAIELGQSFTVNSEPSKTATQFPVFYALDLINFGIKRNMPAAIRLGEKLMSDSVATEHAKLPQDLAMSMKNYMLDYKNNMKYREAMKITGPLNSSSLFHMQNQQSKSEGMAYCLDDPYWQDFIAKNRRREDQWRNPTVFAYRYKQYGLLGEIMDMDLIQKKYDMSFNRPL